MLKPIVLTQSPYLCGGNGCEYRLHTDSGRPAPGILSEWYEAFAVDKWDNEYLVVWRIKDDYNPEASEEADACEWDEPDEVMRLCDMANMTGFVKVFQDF